MTTASLWFDLASIRTAFQHVYRKQDCVRIRREHGVFVCHAVNAFSLCDMLSLFVNEAVCS